MAKKLNQMNLAERIAAVQNCLRVGDKYSRRFLDLNKALPPKYRVG